MFIPDKLNQLTPIDTRSLCAHLRTIEISTEFWLLWLVVQTFEESGGIIVFLGFFFLNKQISPLG